MVERDTLRIVGRLEQGRATLQAAIRDALDAGLDMAAVASLLELPVRTVRQMANDWKVNR